MRDELLVAKSTVAHEALGALCVTSSEEALVNQALNSGPVLLGARRSLKYRR